MFFKNKHVITSIMSDCFICHTSVIVGTMYAFCIDEYVLSLKHCIDACLKNVRDNNKVVDVQLVQVNIVFIIIFTHSNKFDI
jgi:hypothetical protein